MCEARLILVDMVENSNKFWHANQSGNSVTTTYGRVGYDGQSTTKAFPSSDQATKFFNTKLREKLAKGYTHQQTVEASTSTPVQIKNAGLNEIAKSQIKTDCQETVKLIEYLVKVNAHNIYNATGGAIVYKNGTFRTPLGIITQTGIDNARKLLVKMSVYVGKQQFDDREYMSLLSQYLRIIPTDSKMKLTNRIFPDSHAIQGQAQILDSLEASLGMIDQATTTTAVAAPKLFDAELTVVSPTDPDFTMIKKLYRSTLNHGHTSSNLDVKAVWRISIKHMDEAFEKTGKAIGNIKRLWHGSRTCNLLSILKNGFVLPGTISTATIAGSAFGRGVYFSDQSTKSLNYSQGFWSGGVYDNNCFMLLNDVAMGREYLVQHTTSSLPPRGYDSYFCKAGTVFRNNEMVVLISGKFAPGF